MISKANLAILVFSVGVLFSLPFIGSSTPEKPSVQDRVESTQVDKKPEKIQQKQKEKAKPKAIKPAPVQSNMWSIAEQVYSHAKAYGQAENDLLIFIDFTKPSDQPRFYVLNMSTHEVIISTYVAHGSGSGMGSFATNFSNDFQSHCSSIGVFKTLNTYNGKRGRSLRIEGLEYTNSNMESRSVVIHPAPYIGNGQTGHSWGCFAIPEEVAQQVINIIKDGVIGVAYYPSPSWLSNSRYLH